MDVLSLHLLVLIITANGAPIVIRYLAGNKMAYPVDFRVIFLIKNGSWGTLKPCAG